MAAPKTGDTVRLVGPDLGVGEGRVASGARAEVVSFHPADEPGIHNDSEDAVLLAVKVPYVDEAGPDDPKVGYTVRHLARPADEVADTAVWEKI